VLWAGMHVKLNTARRICPHPPLPALVRRYARPPPSYDAAYGAVKAAFCKAFYG